MGKADHGLELWILKFRRGVADCQWFDVDFQIEKIPCFEKLNRVTIALLYDDCESGV